MALKSWWLPGLVLAAGFFCSMATAGDSRPVDLPLKELNGRKVRLREYRGKPVVLNFWATWCVPCREEMPMLVEMEKEYSGRGVQFVAASLDDASSRPKVPEFVRDFQVNFPVLLGATGTDLDDLKLGPAVPATAFLDKEGRILARVRGLMRRDELKERIEWLIGDRSGPAPEPVVNHLPTK